MSQPPPEPPPYWQVAPPTPPGWSRRRSWIALGAVFAVLAAVGGIVAFAQRGTGAEAASASSTTPLGCAVSVEFAPGVDCTASRVIGSLCDIDLNRLLMDSRTNTGPYGYEINYVQGQTTYAQLIWPNAPRAGDATAVCGGGGLQRISASEMAVLTSAGSPDLLPSFLR